MVNNSVNEGYLDINELASYLRTKASWIYQNHKMLGLPSYRLGRKLLFLRSEVDTWIQSQ